MLCTVANSVKLRLGSEVHASVSPREEKPRIKLGTGLRFRPCLSASRTSSRRRGWPRRPNLAVSAAASPATLVRACAP
jgi:hypothetical protein